MVKPVAIYADEGTSQVGVMSLQLAVTQHLQYPSMLVSAENILQNCLDDTSLFIMPGGADMPYCHKLNGEGNNLIRQFVKQGGIYLGICAGAYYACKEIEFKGEEYSVFGQRELAFFDGLAKGCLPQFTGGKRYNEHPSSKAMIPIQFSNHQQSFLYYHGGCTFLPNSTACYQTVAKYPDNTPAIISGHYGKGYYFLSGVHFELQALAYQSVLTHTKPEHIEQEQKTIQYFDDKYGSAIWKQIALALI